MEPITMGMGVGMGLAGAGLGAMGASKAARQRNRAINEWQERRRAILEGLQDQQIGITGQNQGFLSQALSDLRAPQPEIAGQPNGTAAMLPTAPAGTDEFAAAFRNALAPQQAIDDAGLAHHQAQAATGARGNWLASVLGRADGQRAIGRSSYGREAYLAQKRLAENDARLQGFQPSNGAANLSLLGSLLSGGSGAMAGFAGRI